MGMLVVVVVFVLDLVAFALAVAAEQRRTTVSFMYLLEQSIDLLFFDESYFYDNCDWNFETLSDFRFGLCSIG